MTSENNLQVEPEETPHTVSPSSIIAPAAVSPAVPAKHQRTSPSLLTVATIVVIGSMIGGVIGGMIAYLGRPYLDQRLAPVLAAAGLGEFAAPQPVAVALATNPPPPPAPASVANTATGEPAAPAAPPALISPTPDRSPEINSFVISNTRHFTGNPEAKVTIIEFSDFH